MMTGKKKNFRVYACYDEKNEVFKVNIRSKGPVINETAALFGGGGHKFASGVRTRNKEDIPALLDASVAAASLPSGSASHPAYDFH